MAHPVETAKVLMNILTLPPLHRQPRSRSAHNTPGLPPWNCRGPSIHQHLRQGLPEPLEARGHEGEPGPGQEWLFVSGMVIFSERGKPYGSAALIHPH